MYNILYLYSVQQILINIEITDQSICEVVCMTVSTWSTEECYETKYGNRCFESKYMTLLLLSFIFLYEIWKYGRSPDNMRDLYHKKVGIYINNLQYYHYFVIIYSFRNVRRKKNESISSECFMERLYLTPGWLYWPHKLPVQSVK